MGLSYRKSIKLFGNTRLNLSKTGGIGMTTGVKHGRVSVNQKGVRTTLSAGGLQYRKDVSFKTANSNRGRNNNNTATINARQGRNNEEMELKKAIFKSPEIKEFTKTQYTTHMKLLMAVIPVLLIGFIFVPLFLVALGLIVGSLVCMGMNWNRINEEHKARKQIEADVRKRLTEPIEPVINEDYEF